MRKPDVPDQPAIADLPPNQQVDFTLTHDNPVANYRFGSYAMEIRLGTRNQIHVFVYLSDDPMKPSRCVQEAYLNEKETFRDGPFNVVWTERDGKNYKLVITAEDSNPFEMETVRVQAATGAVLKSRGDVYESELATQRSVPVRKSTSVPFTTAPIPGRGKNKQ